MRKFLAILKDSFREAVDGFVIYVMLGLTALFLLLLFSLSFRPAPAEEFIPTLVDGKPPSGSDVKVRVQQFVVIIPDQGHARAVTMSRGVSYSSSQVASDGRSVSLRLGVKSESSNGEDAFRRTVAVWLKPAGETQKLHVPTGQKGPRRSDDTPLDFGVDIANEPEITAADLAAVTDEQMGAFVANQFETHAGIHGVSARRLTDAKGPGYEFDVQAPSATHARGWPQDVALFFGAWKFGRFSLGNAVNVIEDRLVNGLGAGITLILGVVITAFFIPNMLRKGALDLLIAKPIGRSQLLVYKYVGGLTFVFLLSVVAIGGAWAVIGIRSGHWDPRFLGVIPLLTFTFAILYAMSTLVAVMTRNAIAAILITLAFGFLLYLVGLFKTFADLKRNTGVDIMGDWPEWMYTLADTLNNALPRYKDLDKLTARLIDQGSLTPLEQRVKEGILGSPSWSGVLGLSLAYISAFLALACWRFRRRDS